jgi:hypothetical protein
MTRKKPVSLEMALAGGEQEIELPMAVMAKAAPVHTKATVYLPKAALRRLKQMALDHECRINDFLQEGVDMMLAKYGQPSLKEFEGK